MAHSSYNELCAITADNTDGCKKLTASFFFLFSLFSESWLASLADVRKYKIVCNDVVQHKQVSYRKCLLCRHTFLQLPPVWYILDKTKVYVLRIVCSAKQLNWMTCEHSNSYLRRIDFRKCGRFYSSVTIPENWRNNILHCICKKGSDEAYNIRLCYHSYIAWKYLYWRSLHQNIADKVHALQSKATKKRLHLNYPLHMHERI